MTGSQRTGNRSRNVDHVLLTRQNLCCLFDDKERLLLREPSLLEEVVPEEVRIGSAPSMLIVDVELRVRGLVPRRLRDLSTLRRVFSKKTRVYRVATADGPRRSGALSCFHLAVPTSTLPANGKARP